MPREVRVYSNAADKRYIEEPKTTMADDETPFFFFLFQHTDSFIDSSIYISSVCATHIRFTVPDRFPMVPNFDLFKL